MTPEFTAHLATGHTTVARAWGLRRRDGIAMGFTDHDRELVFEGQVFRPDSGLSARALVSGTGLSVDNTEVLGALSADAIREEDIAAGRYDGAEVSMWLVNWADVAQRDLRFRGTLGEIRRGDGAFHAELRGLTEQLNQPRGRVYHRDCAAVLGDGRCRFVLNSPGFTVVTHVQEVAEAQRFRFALMDEQADRWFEKGRLRVTSGAALGLEGIIRADRLAPDGAREIELWEPLRSQVQPGDGLRITAGCDHRFQTCRYKFGNTVNFQGFPHIPGDDWLVTGPRGAAT